MKATLEFNLPDDRNEHRLAIYGGDFYFCLFELGEKMRRVINGKVDMPESTEWYALMDELWELIPNEKMNEIE